MTNIAEAIRERRSIRKYTQTQIPTETLRELLQAATCAPSAHNAQPWQFIILTEDQNKCALADAMAEVWLHELQKDGVPQRTREASARASVERFVSSPVLVVACMSLEDMDTYPDVERQKSERDLAIQSLSAAIQNLLLAAHAQGIGTCWYCAPAFCQKTVRKALEIPEEVEPQALITLGYPAETPNAPPRKPLETVAFSNVWGNPLP